MVESGQYKQRKALFMPKQIINKSFYLLTVLVKTRKSYHQNVEVGTVGLFLTLQSQNLVFAIIDFSQKLI